MLDGLISLVKRQSRIGNIDILPAETAVDDIWTYDRAPGRRIVFPWSCAELPRGFTQLDFVFQEELPCPAERIWIDVGRDGQVELWAATPPVSLAWKILWLETDMYPQGKDLYDATLLAEQVRLPHDLLMRIDTAKKHVPRIETAVQFESFLQLRNCLVVLAIEVMSKPKLSINP